MKKPYNLEARDITLNLVKDRYGPNEKQGKFFLHYRLLSWFLKENEYFNLSINQHNKLKPEKEIWLSFCLVSQDLFSPLLTIYCVYEKYEMVGLS